MKKLYGGGCGRPSSVHPDEQVSFVPAAILTLAASLSPHDREVLAYLLLSSSELTTTTSAVLHPLSFTCTCFRCYMAYWVRWDASPNRQLIHQIIDAFEHHQHNFNNNNTNKTPKPPKKKKMKKKDTTTAATATATATASNTKNPDVEEMNQLLLFLEETSSSANFHHVVADDGIEKPSSTSSSSSSSAPPSSSVRKLVSFIGERMWNLWIQ